MKKLAQIIFCMLITLNLNAQQIKKEICGKKWYPYKYKDVDGEVGDFDKETQSLYTLFNCDGSFESWEDKNVLIKGTWSYNEKTKMIKLLSSDGKKQLNKSVKIVSCDKQKLVYIMKDTEGASITIYAK